MPRVLRADRRQKCSKLREVLGGDEEADAPLQVLHYVEILLGAVLVTYGGTHLPLYDGETVLPQRVQETWTKTVE
jgi:hypothetical protein